MEKPLTLTVATTDTAAKIRDTITAGDSDAYPLSITFSDLTEITGTVRFRFVRGDNYWDRDATIEGNVASLMLEPDFYAAPGTELWVSFLDSNLYTTLRVYFTSIRVPGGNVEVETSQPYPSWAADMREFDVSIGTVTTLAEGESATASITGDVPDKALNLGIPVGAKGEQGPQGDPGPNTVTTTTATDLTGVIAGDGANIRAATAADGDALPVTGGTLGAQMSAVDAQLAQIAPNFRSTAENESAPVGDELLDESGWTSDGWTGDFAAGFTHTPGNTSQLSRTLPNTGTKYYVVSFDTSAALVADELYVTIGGSATFDLYTGGPTHYDIGIRSVSNGDLAFVPISGFNKTISNISVKEVTGYADSVLAIKDSADAISFEVRPTKRARNNAYIGIDAGKRDTAGTNNLGFGHSALQENVAGFWNVGIGSNALKNNVGGSRNVGIGYNSLLANVSGRRNQAIGTFALVANTTGEKNSAIGSDSLFSNIAGSYNVAIGFASLYTNNASHNTAIGIAALRKNTSGNSNVAIGNESLYANTTAIGNTAIGRSAAYKITSGHYNVAIGNTAMYQNTTGHQNVAIGFWALKGSAAGEIDKNVAIGAYAADAITTGGNDNTVLGAYAGRAITTGKRNIVIGANINVASATGDDQLNIGDAITGDLSTKRIGIDVAAPTAKLHLPASTTAASTAPIKINAGILMTTAEAGAIEFDGTNLYFTDSTNTRRTIAVTA